MNRLTITLRSIARRLGMTPILGKLMSRGRNYEDVFCSQLLNSVRPGDVVWDVGANLGFYTSKLVDRVGSAGHVVAIEPAPACAARLREVMSSTPSSNCTIVEAALGSTDERVMLAMANNELDAVHRVVEGAGFNQNTLEVDMFTGQSLQRKFKLRCPQILKIDVEGFEEECIIGLGELLRTARAVFVELHFRILEERGNPHAPLHIVSHFQSNGFQVDWIDHSHLVALRLPQ